MTEEEKRPVVWACRTCGSVDWDEDHSPDEQWEKNSPNHVWHRGMDIGTCKGVMMALFEDPNWHAEARTAALLEAKR